MLYETAVNIYIYIIIYGHHKLVMDHFHISVPPFTPTFVQLLFFFSFSFFVSFCWPDFVLEVGHSKEPKLGIGNLSYLLDPLFSSIDARFVGIFTMKRSKNERRPPTNTVLLGVGTRKMADGTVMWPATRTTIGYWTMPLLHHRARDCLSLVLLVLSLLKCIEDLPPPSRLLFIFFFLIYI